MPNWTKETLLSETSNFQEKVKYSAEVWQLGELSGVNANTVVSVSGFNQRSAKASFSTEAHVASQSDDSSLSNHTDDLLINPKAGIGPAPDCESNKPWLAMQSWRVPTINGGLPSYDSPRRQSSSPLPKWIENFYVWIYDQPVTSPITAGHPLEGITGEIRRLESIDRSIKLTLKNLTRANNSCELDEVAGIKMVTELRSERMRMRKRITINNPLTGLVRQILKLGLRLQLISFVIAIGKQSNKSLGLGIIKRIKGIKGGRRGWAGLLRGKRTTVRLERDLMRKIPGTGEGDQSWMQKGQDQDDGYRSSWFSDSEIEPVEPRE
ncbi:hypothetical protein PPACK8108_LOCUS24608 [Phakopsora pachyrhizi]|uniref:Uncharacterized protein n=1 Tax=Phakopsora pachyrhizi TaxID=170000 RepID=A0AAV0BV98_PHAPC|nr:hypothetical protein PPACK8108_LOCUS24608 [Phakopsora pachyrhizi]